MDKLDKKLLAELALDSRQPYTRLAKTLKTSREVVAYRINKLKKDGVIQGFITDINTQKLGFIGTAVFVNVKAAKNQEFKNFVQKSDFAAWGAELSGIWSFAFSIWGKTLEELDEKFSLVYKEFKDSIIDHRPTPHRRNAFFYEKYLGRQRITKPTGKKRVEHGIDDKDKLLLKELAQNSRASSVELAEKLGLTPPAASQRIKKLEQAGYINKYTLFIDVSKLGLFQYSIFVSNKNLEEQDKFIAFLTKHPRVNYTAEYVGNPFLEFGLFVEDPYSLRPVLQEIEQAFPENRVIEVSLFQKELVSVGPPACVFK